MKNYYEKNVQMYYHCLKEYHISNFCCFLNKKY